MVIEGTKIAATMHCGRPDGWNFFPALFQPTQWLVVAIMPAIGAAIIRRCLWLFQVRRRLRRLTPANDLAGQFGTDGETLERVARQAQIQPACRVNGVDYYDRAAFADAATLLRPAEEPQPALLRPAASSHEEAGDNLLRASGGTEEA